MSTTRSSLLYRTTRSRLRNTTSQPEDAELPVAAAVNTASKGSPQLATAVDTPSKFSKFVTETCPRPYNKSPTETTAKESKVTAVNKPKMSAGAERVHTLSCWLSLLQRRDGSRAVRAGDHHKQHGPSHVRQL